MGSNPYNFTANHDGSAKLTTTATGIDVTGSVTADGLTVANTAVIAGDFDGGTAATYIRLQDDTDNFLFGSNNSLGNFLIKNETADAFRLSVANTGDISFYEDTGTTPKFFWDASAESLGIGTSSPAAPLDVVSSSGAVGAYIRGRSSDNIGSLYFTSNADASTEYGYIQGSSTDLRIQGFNNGLILQPSSGNVGIGCTPEDWDPVFDVLRIGKTGLLFSYDTAGDGMWLGSNAFYDDTLNDYKYISTDPASLYTQLNGTHSWSYAASGTANTQLTFSEAMRIDASGNLLVGKSASGTANTGAELRNGSSNHAVVATSTSETPLVVNRKTNNGSLVNLLKDGVSVGTIGNDGVNLFLNFSSTNNVGIASGTSGGDPVLFPTGNTGAVRDAAVTLGYGTGRWKNLYLSGGVYLGGTGAANKLEDYEEGTWTGTLTGYTSAPSTAITATGTYTKIGRSVTAVISFSNKDSTGASGNIVVTGLPFTAVAGGLGAGWNSRSNTGTGTTNGVMSYISSTNDLNLVNGLGIAITWVSAGTGTYAGYSITYEV